MSGMLLDSFLFADQIISRKNRMYSSDLVTNQLKSKLIYRKPAIHATFWKTHTSSFRIHNQLGGYLMEAHQLDVRLDNS